MQECGFHVKPLFGFQFLRDCSGFLQIRSHISCHFIANFTSNLNAAGFFEIVFSVLVISWIKSTGGEGWEVGADGELKVS